MSIGMAAEEMNRLEAEGYRVVHVFPVNRPLPRTFRAGEAPHYDRTKIFIAVVKEE